MRTKADAGVTLITGIDFYTLSTEEITISLYSRIGNFLDYKTSTDGWELISQGSITGRGVGRYTSIPEEMFTAVDIPGGGGERGTRAFYLAIDTMDLVYQTSEGVAADTAIQIDTPDLEVWEGEVSRSCSCVLSCYLNAFHSFELFIKYCPSKIGCAIQIVARPKRSYGLHLFQIPS
jgi:hypothetical protein